MVEYVGWGFGQHVIRYQHRLMSHIHLSFSSSLQTGGNENIRRI